MTRRSRCPGGVRAFLVLPLLLLGAGCLTPPVAPLDGEVSRDSLAEDEQHLWKQARASAYRLDTSGLLFEDPDLETYLQEVALRLAGDTLAEGGVTPRVRVLSNPDMNAFAFPNGVIYVHTALLARMDNEAQLATMLSRELVHVMQRHALMKHRSDRATGNLMAASGLLLSGVKGGGNAKLLLQAGSFSSMAGYAHALEMSADARGLEMMDRLGYDLEEAPKLFETTIAYLEEVKAQRPPSPLPFAFSTPVHVTHRIGNYRKLLSTRFADSVSSPDRVRNTEVFRRKVRRAAVHQAQLELDRGRFDSAAVTIERAIEVDAADPDAWVILGEARERSNSAPDTEAAIDAAIDAYKRALALDRAHAGAHRALGLLYYRDVKNGGAAPERGAAARVHLARYLEVAPEAPDAGHVRAYLSELGAARDAGPAPSASGGSE